jgi:glycosyltransferase involved in cell wall biosynthesis
LERTLLSLIEQSHNDFELVVCIDGSNDQSEQIVRRYADRFSAVKILHNDVNLGLGPTMNRLVANASGKYVAVAEQDDFYYSNRLKLQIDCLDHHADCGMVSGIADFHDGEKVSSQFPGILLNKQQYPRVKEMFLLNYR